MANKKAPSNNKPEIKYIDLFYMTPGDVTAKAIADALGDTAGLTVELWSEMNILELELSTGNTVDFEPVNTGFKDPSDAAFIKNRGIKTIFAINLSEADLPLITPVFEKIVSKYSGFFCADSADFMPVYAGSSKKQ